MMRILRKLFLLKNIFSKCENMGPKRQKQSEVPAIIYEVLDWKSIEME